MIMYKLINMPFLWNFIKKVIYKFENGEKESKTIRSIYNKYYNVEVDLYSYGCFYPSFNIGGSVKIGRYCSIAGNVHYFGANHPVNLISSSAYFYNKKFGLKVDDVERFKLVIEDDVWIGYGTIITCGCKKIGIGSVIGAGSVVTHDVPPYAIVAGSPARVIKYRFNPEQIKSLQNSKWWLKSPEDLYKYYDVMDNPDRFLELYSEESL